MSVSLRACGLTLSLPYSVWSLSERRFLWSCLDADGFPPLLSCLTLSSESWICLCFIHSSIHSVIGELPVCLASFQVLGYRVEQDMIFSWERQPCNFRGHLLLGRREVLAERLSSLRSLGSSDLVESPLCRGPFVGHSVSSKCSPAPLSHLQRWPLRSHVRHSPLLPLRGQPHQTRLCAGLSVSVLCPLLLTSEWIFCLVSFPPFFLTLWLLLLQAWPGMSALGHLSWHMQDWASKATSPHLSDPVRTTEVLCYLHCLILVCSWHVRHI